MADRGFTLVEMVIVIEIGVILLWIGLHMGHAYMNPARVAQFGVFVKVADRAEAAGGALRAIGARGLCLDVLQIVGVDKGYRTGTRYAAVRG